MVQISKLFPLKHLFVYTLFMTLSVTTAQGSSAEDVLDLDLESLMQIQITSAGRKVQNLNEVPAAAYVIDQEAIRNSGATSIPEALRLVPGIQVARISSSKWAISSRGFNSTFANKLLVQIDGRSVYTPSFSGVYWDMQTVVLEDVERIEVIRGPGATLWGANAVNGIINIITKQASDTQGVLLSGAAGSHDRFMGTARYGNQLNEDTYGRFYLHRHDQASYQFGADQTDAEDNWHTASGGFRLDGDLGLDDSWTLQGDLIANENNQLVSPYTTPYPPYQSVVHDQFSSSGHNLLGRWQHHFSENNKLTTQLYYDYTNRDEIYMEQTHQTLDFDLSHHLQVGERHDLIWGLGYRNIQDEFDNTFQVSLTPDSRTIQLFSGFLQDEIELVRETFWLTIGSKLEHNDYTGFEVQPNIRALWKADQSQTFWASVARAVRTPSRVEEGGRIVTQVIPPAPPTIPFPVPVAIVGNPEFTSEELIAYELGYRYCAAKEFSLDLALFYNDYDHLQSYGSSRTMDLQFSNAIEGDAYGLELTAKWIPSLWLETELGYSFIQLAMTDEQNYQFAPDEVYEDSSPRHQVSARTHFIIGERLHLNLWLRYVDELKEASLSFNNEKEVDAYLNLDANIRWIVREGLELTLVGQNLIGGRRVEFVSESFTAPIEIGPSVYAKITWEY
ncbi:TonB-dependent receptor plug domain-containing protein [Desulfogranum mediterraneum]|uniref:TonB-dependent receptor plug domain-containing protein n=1 Tax=Desulfogranum mediterraneum TaxID=160661 RepID=UPI0003F9D753|nr:TonB-dependent receptor [Desulfogranum mediterraneum]